MITSELTALLPAILDRAFKRELLADGSNAFREAWWLSKTPPALHPERDLFPITQPFGMPVIAYTALRWSALNRPTTENPTDFSVLRLPAWYRFVLQNSVVAVMLAAPQTRAELEEDLNVRRPRGPH
jgi:hypothetical protein